MPRTYKPVPKLSASDARKVVVAPDARTAEGARDRALMLVMARASLSAAEAVSLRADAATELPSDVREAVEAYLRLDRARRETLKTAGPRAWLFQPVVNYRTLEFDRPLSRRSAEMIVKHWGEFAGLGRVTPKMLRGALEGAPAES